ncbi:hypothetical protein DYBT9275_05027 [Dyadobacter sp. CECT 9275]|uniref:Barstar (barnase inhibitor) domain-containing protein n=1 Tax=Dyadobacter helix TaxID=2822344 RepID=A0A916NDM4_9BACT|nr:barstar family protein [Dyadobacter sp. CECT 9275]CAG5011795.1 hypothetical protein DYBT9275_05027 [Dyadobacter sp. CECT 9275]
MKNTHFFLTTNPETVSKTFPEAFIGILDGKKTTSLKDFYEEIAVTMNFPEDAGNNLDALDELLNDLDWIEQEKVIILITNSADWLQKERSTDKILTIIDILDATAEDWKWMDEDEEVHKKELKIIFDDSARIRTLLEEQEIRFKII